MKKIGLLGGTFDPIHLTHIQNAKLAYQQLGLDEVWLIPVLNNPFTKTIVATSLQRLDMIKLAIKDEPYIKICDIELKKDPQLKSYTYDTVKELKTLYDADFYFIIGYDQASKFDLWYKSDELAKMAKIAIISRLGYELPSFLNKYHMIELKTKATNTSSSAIRQGVHLEDLNQDVLKYMMEHSIYTKTMIKSRMSEKRYIHTLSMTDLACEFALCNDVDEKKARVAGLLHDVAKEMDKDEMMRIMETHFKEHLDASFPVWHQWVSSYVAKTEFKIDDPQIIQAIQNHTTGSCNMSKLDMCIYCADQYDPSRGYDSSKEIELCKKDIEQGFKQALIDFYEFSKAKNRKIDQVFFDIYSKYVLEENK